MATKDWKKEVGNNKWEKIKNITEDDRLYLIIELDKVEVPISWFGKRTNKEIRVSFKSRHGSENRAEYFKTKSQALKFAKSYMRSH